MFVHHYLPLTVNRKSFLPATAALVGYESSSVSGEWLADRLHWHPSICQSRAVFNLLSGKGCVYDASAIFSFWQRRRWKQVVSGREGRLTAVVQRLFRRLIACQQSPPPPRWRAFLSSRLLGFGTWHAWRSDGASCEPLAPSSPLCGLELANLLNPPSPSIVSPSQLSFNNFPTTSRLNSYLWLGTHH